MKQPSENTPLTSGVTYAFVQGRKQRLRQYQCCLCAILVSLIIAIATVVVSYAIRDDLRDAIDAGTDGLKARDELERNATGLLMFSPSYKHQKAVATTRRASSLARAGFARNIASEHYSRSKGRKYNGKKPMVIHCTDKVRQMIDSAKWSSELNCSNVSISNCTKSKYRTFDGSCNNVRRPTTSGVAFTPFRRTLPAWYSDGIGKPRTTNKYQPLPAATTISNDIHKPLYRADPKFSVMLAVWGQFVDHDITATALSRGHNGSSIACCNRNQRDHPECFPVVDNKNGKCMEFVRSAPAGECCLGPRNQINQASAYIDGSMIYGSERELCEKLRTFRGGFMDMLTLEDGRELLPPSMDVNDGCNREQMNKEGKYCFLSGDPRSNENLHLTTMHLLWARNHNNVSAELSQINPTWTDEQLFQEARRIVAAQIQHITYNEFLPVILGEKLTSKHHLHPNASKYRYNDTLDASIANEFATAAFRFAHTLIPGLMKVLANDNSSYEFVQLHKMLFDPYRLYNKGELDDIIRGAMNTEIEAADPYFTDELKSHLFESNDNETEKKHHCGGLDLVALNIQRGRDHGLAGYPDWRQRCGLSKPDSFDDLLGYMDPNSVERISKLYDEVEDLDLYSGALSEKPIDGSLLGPTASCIIVDQFVRLKFGDRFWYENMIGTQAFSPEQIEEIEKVTLASVICDTSDDIHEITPWVMKRDGDENQYMDCSLLPRMDLTKWKNDD